MKKIWLSMLLSLVLLLSGCGIDYEEQLIGAWYSDKVASPVFTFYDDATCEVMGEYEYSIMTWSVVNDNELQLRNYYGEINTIPIIEIKDNYLVLGDEYSQVKLWNRPQTENLVGNNSDNAVGDSGNNEESNLLSVYQTEDYTLGTFIEGTAIIEYKINDEWYGALIDREGTVIKELDAEEFSPDLRDDITGACYGSKGVLDSEGNVIFTVEDGQKVMCVGDSMILVYEEALGFENAEARIGVVTFDGEWISPLTSDNKIINDEKNGLRCEYGWRYTGEGCFIVDNSDAYRYSDYKTVIFDVYNNTSTIVEHLISRNEKFENGTILWEDIFLDHQGMAVKKMSDITSIGDGMLYSFNDKILYQYTGEAIKDYSQYKNASVSNFYNGVGYFEAVGADGKQYFSIIDSNGEFMFEPIVKERTYSNQQNGFLGDFYNGVFTTDQKSFDLEGNLLFDFSDEITSCREGIVIVNDMYMTIHGEVIEPMIVQNL